MKKAWLFFGSLALMAISAWGQDIRYNFDETADFSKFKTYKWVPITGATPPQGLTDKQIRDAFDTELAKKGLAKVENEAADLFIGYQFGVEKEQRFGSYGSDGEYGAGWAKDKWYGSSAIEQTSTVYEGELSLSMYEAAKHTLAWRGVASKTVDLNAKSTIRQKHLVKAVQKLMEYYPPGAIVGR